ncbi:MAG: prenyltransferase [Chloroflexota bacterium]|nr:MAG: prenyltransferase [Chloroflexota bacterium]
MNTLVLLIRLARPHFLLGGILLYALGAGIARYLGATIDWGIYFLGQAWVTLMQLSTHFLNEYFDSPADLDNKNRTPFSGGSGAIGPGKLPRAVALWAAVSCLTVVASLTVLLMRDASPGPAGFMVMLLIFLGAFFYAVPPVKLESTGYGELTTSFIVANLVPALALILQFGDLHRLLAMTTFPLTALHIAMLLTFELPDYAADLKHEKQTMLVRLGWQNGMNLHNLMVLTAFLLLGLAVFRGLSIAIALPAFLVLPLGILQIWSINRIASGAKPNWTLLTLSGVMLFGIAAYLITFSLWTR